MNPLEALIDRLQPHHQKAEQETRALTPTRSAPLSTFAHLCDNLPAGGGDGARSGARTLTTHMVAGGGSGGSPRTTGLSVS